MPITTEDCDKNVWSFYEKWLAADSKRDKDLYYEGINEWLDMRLFLTRKGGAERGGTPVGTYAGT